MSVTTKWHFSEIRFIVRFSQYSPIKPFHIQSLAAVNLGLIHQLILKHAPVTNIAQLAVFYF